LIHSFFAQVAVNRQNIK